MESTYVIMKDLSPNSSLSCQLGSHVFRLQSGIFSIQSFDSGIVPVSRLFCRRVMIYDPLIDTESRLSSRSRNLRYGGQLRTDF